MAIDAPSFCIIPGCPEKITRGRYCDAHWKEKNPRAEEDRRRGSSTDRGYDSEWQRYREAYWRKHPVCELCQAAGRTTLAVDVDHKIPIRAAPELRLRWSNLQALCRECHRSKTEEDKRKWPVQ